MIDDTAIERKMLPEVREFLDTWEAIDANVNELRDAYQNGDDLSDETYRLARLAWRNAQTEKFARRGEACGLLVSKTEDKLVKFIMAHYIDDHTEQAIDILKLLPASLKELEAFAEEAGWCDTWFDAVDKAATAGIFVFDGAEKIRRSVYRDLRYDMGRYDAKRTMEKIDRYVELRINAAVERVAKTANVVVDALSK